MMNAMSYYPGPKKNEAIDILINRYASEIKLLAANTETQKEIDIKENNINSINEQIKKINNQIILAVRSEDFENAADLKKQRINLEDRRSIEIEEKKLIDIKYILPDDIVDKLFRESVTEGVDAIYNGKEECPGSLTGWGVFVVNDCIKKISEIFTNKLKKNIKSKHNSKSASNLLKQKLFLDPEGATGEAHMNIIKNYLKNGGKKFTKKKYIKKKKSKKSKK